MAQKYIEGDLVMTRTEPNNFTPNGVVCKFVDYEARDKVLIRTINGIDSFVVEKEQVAPIPLTPEILEKNGWKKDGKWYKLSTKRTYLYITKDAKVNDEFLVCVGDDKHNLASVSFVHELQHLLYGLKINSEMEV